MHWPKLTGQGFAMDGIHFHPSRSMLCWHGCIFLLVFFLHMLDYLFVYLYATCTIKYLPCSLCPLQFYPKNPIRVARCKQSFFRPFLSFPFLWTWYLFLTLILPATYYASFPFHVTLCVQRKCMYLYIYRKGDSKGRFKRKIRKEKEKGKKEKGKKEKRMWRERRRKSKREKTSWPQPPHCLSNLSFVVRRKLTFLHPGFGSEFEEWNLFEDWVVTQLVPSLSFSSLSLSSKSIAHTTYRFALTLCIQNLFRKRQKGTRKGCAAGKSSEATGFEWKSGMY